MLQVTLWFETLARDTRHGLRRLRRDWRFTAAAVLILGLGIGAITAVFSVVNAVLLRGAPLPEPERLVEIYQNGSNPAGVDANSYPAYLDVSRYTDVFAATTAASVPLGVSYQLEGTLRRGVAEYATATYLSVLGLRPSLGRWFNAAEDARGAGVVAVLGHRTWTRTFNADPSVIGRIVRIDGVPVTIVGVGPAGHNGTINIGIVTDFWLPTESLPAMGGEPRMLERRPEEAAFLVKARLKAGITVAQAQAAMDILGRRLASEYPNEDPGRGLRVVASKDVRVHPQLDTAVAAIGTLLLVVVGLVLAIACSNLATLLVVRGASRRKDVGVRLAIGATRGQIVRQLVVESLALALAGGAAGCVLAAWGIQSLRSVELPVSVDVTLDARVLAFALAVTLATGVAFGLAPALNATRVELLPTLRGDAGSRPAGRRRLALKDALIVCQVALSVLLLGGASLFLQMLDASRAQVAGYAVDGVAMVETDPRYADHPAARTRTIYAEVLRRIAAAPGVESAALAHGLPMRTTSARLVVEGAPRGAAPALSAAMVWAGPGYLETLRIPLLYGRAFDERDRADTPRVAVVSESMARRHFGTANAVGRRFRMESDPGSWMEIVGVARDTGTADLAGDLVDPARELFYRSFTQFDVLPTTLLARTGQDAAALVAVMRRELRAVDAGLPVIAAKTMARDREDSLAASKAVAALLLGLGALGTLLASIGLYAVVAFAVSRRSREIGIRMALGARGRQVIWDVTRGIAGLVGAGTAVGLVFSLVATLAVRAAYAPAPGLSLYRPRIDPLGLLVITALMALVGVAAALVPARRAALTDPLNALHHD